jgi:hypothetical protein
MGVGTGLWVFCHARDEHRQRLTRECVRELGESRTKIGSIGVGPRRDYGGTPGGSVRVARFSDAVNLQTHDGPEDMKLWFADQEVKQLLEVASDVDIDPLVVLKWGGWADWTRFSTTTNARTRQRRSDESVKKSAGFSSIWCLSKRYRSLIALKWMIGAMTNFKK